MTIVRRALTAYLLVTWAMCVATYLADLHEGILIGLVPAVVPFILDGTLPLDGGNLGHVVAVVLLALLQAAVVYTAALGAQRARRRKTSAA